MAMIVEPRPRPWEAPRRRTAAPGAPRAPVRTAWQGAAARGQDRARRGTKTRAAAETVMQAIGRASCEVHGVRCEWQDTRGGARS